MDDWDRALHREWVSLDPSEVSRNALAFPYPLEEPGGSSKVKLKRSWQRRSVATRDISPQPQASTGSDSVAFTPCRQEISQRGRYDSREQRVRGQYGDGSFHITEIPAPSTYLMEGNSEDGTTTSGSTQTTIASRTWNSDTLPGNGVEKR